MFRNTALLVVGMLAAGSLAPLAAQQTTPAKKPETQQPAAQPAAPHWTAAQIKEAQAALVGLKLYTGKETGTMNTATEQALRKFQQEHKLPVTGQLSDSTMALLRTTKPAAPAKK